MRVTIITGGEPVIYETAEFVEIEANEPVTLEGTERGGVQVFRTEDPVLYACDPDKNTECRKTGCYLNGGECYQTKHLKYARGERHGA